MTKRLLAILTIIIAGCAEQQKVQFKQGHAAFNAGVPYTANPFLEYSCSGGEAALWLQGWSVAKTEKEKGSQ